MAANANSLNKNTEAIARAIWAQVQNGYVKQNGNLNGLNQLKIVKKRITNGYYKPKPGMFAGLTGMFSGKASPKIPNNAAAPPANGSENSVVSFQPKPNSAVKRVRNWAKKLTAKKLNASPAAANINVIRRLSANQKAAAAVKKAGNNKRRAINKIAANKQKRLQNLVRMLKLNNLIRNDPLAANQKIYNLRSGQRFINKRPLLRAITNQDKINLKRYLNQEKTLRQNITNIKRRDEPLSAQEKLIANAKAANKAAANAKAKENANIAAASARASQLQANTNAALQNQRNRIAALGNDILKQVGGFGKGSYFKVTPGAYNRTAAKFKNRINGVNKKALTNYINSLKTTNKWKGKNNGDANRAKTVINKLIPSKN